MPGGLGRIGFLWLVLTTTIAAQYLGTRLNTEQFPPDIIWKEIRTPHFLVLVPRDCEDRGQEIARFMELVRPSLIKGMSTDPSPLHLILNTRTADANGYATLLPRRSEWYTTPPTSTLLGTNDWLTILGLHEYRHIVQLEKARNGMTRFASWLFGEAGWGGLALASIPRWFWEGDAVGMETALTRSGRGRMPDFLRGFRTLSLSGRRYTYYKAYLGSYADFVPSHYHLGYLMTSHVRERHGAKVWPELIERSSWLSFVPGIFSMSLKARIGKTSSGLYEETMSALDSLWSQQDESLIPTSVRPLAKDGPLSWGNDLYVQEERPGSRVAVRSSLDDPPRLISIQEDGKVRPFGPYLEQGPVSIRGSHAVWAESSRDRRWGKQSWSDLIIYDLATATARKLTERGKWFSPSLSPDGSRIVAVHNGEDLRHHLMVLDASTGDIQDSIPNPENSILQYPAWSEEGTAIIFTRVRREGGKSVSLFSTTSRTETTVIAYSDEDIRFPRLKDSLLIFISSRSGLDQIHAIQLGTGRRGIVAWSRFGAEAPSFTKAGQSLLWSDYQVTGYRAVESALDSLHWEEDTTALMQWPYVETLSRQEGGPIDAVPARGPDYPATLVSGDAEVLNFHSWGILPSGDGLSSTYEAALYSRNSTNTLGLSVGYRMGYDGQSGEGFVLASYAGWYPVIDVSLSTGKRQSDVLINGRVRRDTWTESSVSMGFRLPFDYSAGLWSSGIHLGVEGEWTRISDKEVRSIHEHEQGNLAVLHFSLQSFQLLQWIRDIMPRHGFTLRLAYSTTVSGLTDYRGMRATGEVGLYVPGLWRNQGLWLFAGWEGQQPDPYWFDQDLAQPRGYPVFTNRGLTILRAQYAIPLWYPDLNLWSLLNFKRLRANLFSDAGFSRGDGLDRDMVSTGAELMVDMNALTQPVEIGVGLRWSYLWEVKDRDLAMVLSFRL